MSTSEGAAFHLQIKINYASCTFIDQGVLQLFKRLPSLPSSLHHLFPIVLITVMTEEITRTLPPNFFTELTAAIRGDVYLPTDPKYVMIPALHLRPHISSSFVDFSRMFNGDVKVAALAVACPLDAQDVSR